MVVNTIAQSCRCLTVLKLSDYQFKDPNDLLILCGKVVVSKANNLPENLLENPIPARSEGQDSPLNSDSVNKPAVSEEVVDRVTNMLHLNKLDGADADLQNGCCPSTGEGAETQSNDQKVAVCVNAENITEDGEKVEETTAEELVSTREEEQNQRGQNVSDNGNEAENGSIDGNDGEDGGGGGDGDGDGGDDEDDDKEGDYYRDDLPVCPLEVEDHSRDVGCLELDTLWLEGVNLTDQVAAVLLQNLLHLRDVNFSGTDICNPWRLIDKSCSKHFRHLQDLDITSTSLSRSALELIPEVHPDLRKLSISSTTLPPLMYRNITKLSGLGDLQLIGGQFYPCEPGEIFTNGILPAVKGVGRHLESLNMAFFAHVEVSMIALNCPVIRHLDLSRTDIFFTCPCSSLRKHCPNLVTLSLSHAHIEGRDPSTLRVVSEDVAIQQIIGDPCGLEELHLSGLTLSSDGVRTLFHGVKYPLKFIGVEFCKTLTIAGVCHLWKVCPSLTRIDMTHSKDISISDCKRFAEHCYESRPAFKSEGTLNWK